MSFLKSIKSIFSNSNSTQLPEKSVTNIINPNKYFKNINTHLFKLEQTITLATETEGGWDNCFSVEKENPKLIGFEKRSKKKLRLLYKSEEQLVTYAASIIEIINKNKIKRVIFKDTPLEKMTIVDANVTNVILRNKENIAYINLDSCKAYLYSFKWQPFSSAVGDDYWLVGTRQTYEGPGELYLFNTNGEVNWAINFTEPPMNTMFGPVHMTAYHLKVSQDFSDIFVSSMDKLYRFTPEGKLMARIAISELKEEELRRKHEETQRALAIPPKDKDDAINRFAQQIAEQFTEGFSRLTFHSPFTGFAHDPKTDMLFILEEEGRVTGWNSKGKLVWTNIFKEKGRFISWIDEKLVLSFITGETLWLDRDGFYIFGAKLPKEAWTISLIPKQSRYLIVCKDNRLYELDKTNGELATGTVGHPGMTLFNTSSHHIFFDGEYNKAGHLWLAPQGHKWSIFKKTEIDSLNYKNTLNSAAPEIKETKPFKLLWTLKAAEKDEFFGKRIVDFKNQQIYVSEKPKFDSKKIYDTVKDEEERRKYFDAQDLVCYDFKQNRLWSKRFYHYLFSVFLSPDGENIFIGVPLKVNISYEPGFIIILNKKGEKEGQIEGPAHGFNIDFVSNDEGIVHFATDRGEEPKIFSLFKDQTKKWRLGEQRNKESLRSEFGAGIKSLKLNNFSLNRVDKKKYVGRYDNKESELKVSAAIYEAYEVSQQNLLTRIGNKTITYFNENYNKVWNVKTEESVLKVVVGISTFIVVSKEEIASYNLNDGTLIWRMSAPPKSSVNKVYWSKKMITFIWFVGNQQEYYVATINENGDVYNSKRFTDLMLFNDTVFNEDQNMFIVQKSNTIEGYKVY